jgi:hypothetical protein
MIALEYDEIVFRVAEFNYGLITVHRKPQF